MLPYVISLKEVTDPHESNFPIILCSTVKKDWRWFHVPTIMMLLLPSCVVSYYTVCWTLNVQLNTITVSHLYNRNTEGFYHKGSPKVKNHTPTYLGKVTAQAVFHCLIHAFSLVRITFHSEDTLVNASRMATHNYNVKSHSRFIENVPFLHQQNFSTTGAVPALDPEWYPPMIWGKLLKSIIWKTTTDFSFR
jgi:hypothetical protein